MKRLLLSICYLSFVIFFPVFAQTEIERFRPGVTVEGVNYFLPKTVFEVVLTAEKTVTKPGEFAAYADRYLRLKEVPTVETTAWTLKAVSLMPYGVPDSTKAYSIKLRAKTSAPLVSLTDDGLLLGVNIDVTPEPAPELPQPVPAPKAVNGRDFMTHDILAAGSTSKMAQLTAEEIYDIRDSRNALVRGEADNMPKDGAQLKLMLDNLDKQSAALESLFKGQQITSTEVLSFDYEPSANPEECAERHLLCRFSRKLGLVATDDLSGEPIWITVKPQGSLPPIESDAEAAKKKAKLEQGVYVNQPRRAQISIFTATQTLLTAEFPIAQLGTVEVLSDALFNKKLETRVTLHQHTGSVKQVE
ncbi:MAG: DUF4831 family protein [Bacteroidaceae bacterium]|nr:DUF4831 family protein [Bacteroidaceae bacterium]